ncbi:MAG TPA: DUF2167 domain-containing protein [Thermoanaerobaculia bacterium]|nr:DUF2167 domain-containing protein [Thermoanaerobaculia bacterium]
MKSSRLFACALALFLPLAALAQEDPGIEWTAGPTKADLGSNLAQIDVPEGYVFADGPNTRKLMELYGNPATDREVGAIAPKAEGKNWLVVFEYEESGYVKDDDKDKIDADAILKSITEGTEASNEQRKEMGSDAIHIVGWFEQPHYDSKTNNLVWAIEGKDDPGGNRFVNYDVRLLGRRGYMSATLITGPESLAADLPEVNGLLSGFSYKTGNRYAEWVKGDKVAEYGLTALVAGGAGAAAVKLGLFAKLGKMLAKGWKLVVAGIAALIALLRKLFGKKEEEAPTVAAP